MLKPRGLPPGEENSEELAVHKTGATSEYRQRQPADPGYVDTEYRTIEGEKDLRDYISILLRRKKTILIVAAFLVVVVGIYTFVVAPVYRSLAILEIEKESGTSLTNIGDLLSGGLGGNSENEVYATQLGIIQDRAIIEALIDKMNLGQSQEFADLTGVLGKVVTEIKSRLLGLFGMASEPNPLVFRERLIKEVSDRVSAYRDRQSRLIVVGIEAGSEKFAQDMLQNLLQIYLGQNLDKRRRVQKEACAWIKAELNDAQDRVVKSLAALVDFTSKHGFVAIDDSANHIIAFFQKAAEGLVQSKQQLLQFEALEKQHGFSEAAAIMGVRTPDLEQLIGKLSVLESEYSQMSEIYSESYPKLILLRKQIQFLKARIEKEQKKTVSAAIESAKKQEDLSEQAFEKAKQTAMDSKSLGVQFAVLKKEADTNEEILKILLTKSKELELSTEIIGNNVLTVVPPSMPVFPVRPRKGLYLGIGAMFGLVLGVFAAFIQERLDTSVQDSRDLEKLRLPNLGMIPNYQHIQKIEARDLKRIGGSKEEKDHEAENLRPELIACTNPSSALSEAFSVVRTSLSLTTALNVCKTVMVTSATPGEGKSFVSTSLGAVMANYGQKVLLVEGDLRKPRVSVTFGAKHDRPGLTTLLTFANIELTKCYNPTEIPNLFVMSSGPLPKDPARLIHSDNMKSLMDRLGDEFDVVLIDSPPVAGLPDARILAACVDGVIFVVRQGHAAIDVIRSARQTLAKVGGNNILGAIFNNVGVSTSRYAYSSYGKYGSYGAYGGYNQHYNYNYNRYYKSGGEKQA